MSELFSTGDLARRVSATGDYVEPWEVRQAATAAGVEARRVGGRLVFTEDQAAAVRGALEKRRQRVAQS
jgi:hypothetical protein